jgi:hypothetical protein
MFKTGRRAIAVTLLASLFLVLVPPRKAQADEPVTTVIVTVAAVTTIAAGVVYLWDYFFGEDQKVCTTTTVTTTTTNRDGTSTTTTTTTTTYSQSPAQIRIPEDMKDLSLPPGVELSENLFFDGRDDQSLDLQYQDVFGHASILDPSIPEDVVEVTYDVERETVFRWLRPPGYEGAESTIRLAIKAQALEVSTTDVSQTHGLASLEFEIGTEELGVLYSTSVNATQGARSVISGNIPSSAFQLSTGRAELADYAEGLNIPVPLDVNTLTFKITMRTHGIGQKL